MSYSSARNEIVTIAGNRPEIIKLSQLVNSMNKDYKNAFVYTGQHYSTNMKDVFFNELNVKFDYDLQSNTSDVNVLREKIRNLLHSLKPSHVIVYGDTNSTLAGAFAAKDLNCRLIHIEAGLRCFDLSRPEERNRIQVDSISDYFLAPTELNGFFLKYENAPSERVYVTGNLIVDVCRKFSNALGPARTNEYDTNYILLTLHRAAVVDDPVMLKDLAVLLSRINYKIIFPIHPRTKDRLTKYNIHLPKNVIAIDPLGYLDFLALLKECMIVMTDSGGVQEEAVILGKPCITLSNTTERQETILLNANRLFYPLNEDKHDKSISDVIEEMQSRKITVNPYGEEVTKRSVEVISNIIDTDKEKIKPQIRFSKG
ncbi:MAG TPA: UDP-N-acetylglucosamine 2-epimerase (non-hydrolyzing) [Nitrososphaeraceae archaeon]|nr:UDP-N-acetylglucosamine 2-epimerase (non-hydrolyzing) [Nitrososphaeraceae archaeon]